MGISCVQSSLFLAHCSLRATSAVKFAPRVVRGAGGRASEVITHEKANSGSDKANSDKCKEMRKHWGMTKGFSHVDADQKNVKRTKKKKKPDPRCAENTLKSNGYKILKTGTVLTFCKGIPGKRWAFTAVSLFSFSVLFLCEVTFIVPNTAQVPRCGRSQRRLLHVGDHGD